MRRATSADQDPGWRILYKTGNKFVQVGQTKQRPSRDDLVRLRRALLASIQMCIDASGQELLDCHADHAAYEWGHNRIPAAVLQVAHDVCLDGPAETSLP